MMLGMATLINITMVGALVSLAGNIPDSSFLVILSRYLKKREEPEGALLYPAMAASRLERLRRRALQVAAAVAVIAAGLTVWTLLDAWGAAVMLAVTAWTVAVNLAFYHIPLALWKRRAGKMREDAVEEAWRKSRRIPPEQQAEGSGEDTMHGEAVGGELLEE
ncbi:MAG: hypothetical protein C4536_04630 [Actinobacteria bacterium]|jgi:hypothetical protein|nr:MAG: hypothetical protein C4536_04630 [Actinomycetota bacterium]